MLCGIGLESPSKRLYHDPPETQLPPLQHLATLLHREGLPSKHDGGKQNKALVSESNLGRTQSLPSSGWRHFITGLCSALSAYAEGSKPTIGDVSAISVGDAWESEKTMLLQCIEKVFNKSGKESKKAVVFQVDPEFAEIKADTGILERFSEYDQLKDRFFDRNRRMESALNRGALEEMPLDMTDLEDFSSRGFLHWANSFSAMEYTAVKEIEISKAVIQHADELHKQEYHNPPNTDSPVAFVAIQLHDAKQISESIPQAVLQESLQLVHETVHLAATKFNGYEVLGSIGRFVFAFATVEDALQMAVKLQTDLVNAKWPVALQGYPPTRPIRETNETSNCLVWNGLRLRTAIANGPATREIAPDTGKVIFLGPTIDQAVSLVERTHGGEIVLSDKCFEQVKRSSLVQQLDVATLSKRRAARSPRNQKGSAYSAVEKNLASRVTQMATEAAPEQELLDLWEEQKQQHLEAVQSVMRSVTLLDTRPLHAGAAPQGNVAIIFTDVQDSTKLWDSDLKVMQACLAVHNKILREIIGQCDGFEVKTEGDAFMIALSSPVAAVKFCLDSQHRLLEAPWPPELLARNETKEVPGLAGPLWRGLRVRMGGHFGAPICQVDQTTGRMDYLGPVVNKAARVGGQARGGEIFISETMYESAKSAKRELGQWHPVYRSVGTRRLKGISELVTMYSVCSHELLERFPNSSPSDENRFVEVACQTEGSSALPAPSSLATATRKRAESKPVLSEPAARLRNSHFGTANPNPRAAGRSLGPIEQATTGPNGSSASSSSTALVASLAGPRPLSSSAPPGFGGGSVAVRSPPNTQFVSFAPLSRDHSPTELTPAPPLEVRECSRSVRQVQEISLGQNVMRTLDGIRGVPAPGTTATSARLPSRISF
eukprot:TRINITY_DN10106_c0_g1_i1.p1 TRINITY_DN10106_c0_g1~~TRINITY_DN10106_c0_g1_i1.p1  ORF type:complete len:888 (-),score=103.56 TRINITY_DN10106_c0_g1_i1:287-2950(-)